MHFYTILTTRQCIFIKDIICTSFKNNYKVHREKNNRKYAFFFVLKLINIVWSNTVNLRKRKYIPHVWMEIFPGGLDGKESACNVGDLGSIPDLGRSPGGGHSNSLQYSCLENLMDRGVWWATVHGISKSQTWLTHTHIHTHTFV